MSYVPFPIRKHRFTVCQNVHCGFGWRIMRSGLGFVACYVREAGIRPDVGRGIFRRGTLRRMGSVFPGLPRRLYGNDLIGMSIGVAVGCGRRPPMGRHGSGVPLHKRLIPRLAENWRSLRRVSYMELELCCGGTAEAAVTTAIRRPAVFRRIGVRSAREVSFTIRSESLVSYLPLTGRGGTK